MSMFKSIGLGVIALSPFGAALALSASAAAERCRVFMASFNPQTASVEHQQYYAICVRVLYPVTNPIQETFLIWARVGVAAMLLGALAGAVIGWREAQKDKHADSVGGFFIGAMGGGASVAIAWALYYGVKFVLGAV